jgi:hypothetical protein
MGLIADQVRGTRFSIARTRSPMCFTLIPDHSGRRPYQRLIACNRIRSSEIPGFAFSSQPLMEEGFRLISIDLPSRGSKDPLSCTDNRSELNAMAWDFVLNSSQVQMPIHGSGLLCACTAPKTAALVATMLKAALFKPEHLANFSRGLRTARRQDQL